MVAGFDGRFDEVFTEGSNGGGAERLTCSGCGEVLFAALTSGKFGLADVVAMGWLAVATLALSAMGINKVLGMTCWLPLSLTDKTTSVNGAEMGCEVDRTIRPELADSGIN